MPLGIVSESEFLKEMVEIQKPSSETIPPKEEPPSEHEHGRNEGDNNVPESLRKIIGEEAVINGRTSAVGLAGLFGISPSSVSAYAKGATSTTTYDTPKAGIVKHLNKARRRAIKRASTTLNQALSAITQEKLDYTDARDLSGIAKDMSVVIKNLEPQQVPPDDPTVKQPPQFIIFAPQFRREESFEVIDISNKME